MTETRKQIEEFLSLLWGDMKGNAVVGTLDRPGPKGQLRYFADFKYPEQLPQIVDWVEARSSGDVYASPLLYGEERNPDTGKVRRIPENAISSRCVYQDSDHCPIEAFRLKPSIHLTTSSGKYQDFWLLTEPIEAHAASELSHKVAVAHREDGSDPSSWSANKLLRIPGTYNTKHGFPEAVTVQYSGMIYDELDVAGAYEDVELESRPLMRLPSDVSYESDMDLPDYATALNKLPATFGMDLLTKPAKEGTDRSRMRYRLLCELFRVPDLAFEDVLSLAWHAPVSRKWKEDPRNIRGLVAEALKAQAEIAYETGNGLEAPTVEEIRQPGGVATLLTDEERFQIAGETTFIDRFCNWAASKLGRRFNAPYARAAAWQCLSAALADTAFIPRGNGPEFLNMFTMVIGDSGTGKTSIRKLWSLFMDELYDDDAGWFLGSNASPNALHEKLLERNGKFSSFNSDEAHGWFKQVNGQQWSDGIYENIAGYYDGEVPPILRTSNRELSGKRGTTIFNMYMMGTMKGELSLANVLDKSLFLSGMLARFVWYIGDTVEVTEESMREDETNSDVVRLGYDPMVRQWIAEFRETKKRLQTRAKRKFVPIPMARDALDRLSQAKWDVVKANRENPNWEVLEPALRNRFGPNIRKAATLLAVEDGFEEVQMKHLLLALQAAEEWLASLLIMVEKISDSEWKRLCDEIFEFVASRSRVSVESVNRRFASRRARDLNEQVDAIKSQGRVKEVTEGGRKWLTVNE